METSDQSHLNAPASDRAWRVAPLVFAGIVFVGAFLIPVMLVLAPLSLAVSVAAYRRTERRGVLLGVGLALALCLNIWLVALIVNLVLNGR